MRSGDHPRVVQERARPLDHRVTLGFYSHVGPVMHEDAAELVAWMFRRT